MITVFGVLSNTCFRLAIWKSGATIPPTAVPLRVEWFHRSSLIFPWTDWITTLSRNCSLRIRREHAETSIPHTTVSKTELPLLKRREHTHRLTKSNVSFVLTPLEIRTILNLGDSNTFAMPMTRSLALLARNLKRRRSKHAWGISYVRRLSLSFPRRKP